jgi:hypothetical protein
VLREAEPILLSLPSCPGAFKVLGMHFRCYRMRVICEECGSSCPVDQPALAVRCTACGSDQQLPADFLRDQVFGLTLKQILPLAPGEDRPLLLFGGGHQFFGMQSLRSPTCNACATPTDLAQLPLGSTGQAPCRGCGAMMATYPAPAWLRSLGQHALQVFFPLVVETPRSLRPITLGCPECGAKLKVGHGDRRIVTCGYCDTDIFLPEEVWRTFHPVRKRASWFVWFEK